ncbi:hypothetical protein [Nocardia bhagyanarayanae]|uniref:hypothetical protein n=1 Tax=Nocardia bhagyanarayanae TaxID=1215925 RepID=UPI001151C0AC|nr:hypothetical protein [Nocardia bhagyanarayanae]
MISMYFMVCLPVLCGSLADPLAHRSNGDRHGSTPAPNFFPAIAGSICRAVDERGSVGAHRPAARTARDADELEAAIGLPAEAAREAALRTLDVLADAVDLSAALGTWVRRDLPLHDEWLSALPVGMLRNRIGSRAGSSTRAVIGTSADVAPLVTQAARPRGDRRRHRP